MTEENQSDYSIHDVVLPLPGFDVMYPDNQVGQWYREMLDEANLKDLRNKVKYVFRIKMLDVSLPHSSLMVLIVVVPIRYLVYLTLPFVQLIIDYS